MIVAAMYCFSRKFASHDLPTAATIGQQVRRTNFPLNSSARGRGMLEIARLEV
jgi:hypothetical protein